MLGSDKCQQAHRRVKKCYICQGFNFEVSTFLLRLGLGSCKLRCSRHVSRKHAGPSWSRQASFQEARPGMSAGEGACACLPDSSCHGVSCRRRALESGRDSQLIQERPQATNLCIGVNSVLPNSCPSGASERGSLWKLGLRRCISYGSADGSIQI